MVKERKRIILAFLFGMLMFLELIAVSPAVSANSSNQFYDYYLQQRDLDELNETLSSIMDISSPNTVVIPFFTDFHMQTNVSKYSLAECKPVINKQLAIYDRIAAQCDFDFTVFGGDYLDNSSETSYPAAYTSLSYLGEMFRQTNDNSPRFVLKGNHDDNTMYTDYVNGFISNKDFYNAIGKLDVSETCRDAGNIDRFYGYYDIPNKKIRVFCLNTVDIPTSLDAETNSINYRGQWDTGFSQQQLQFVADHLYFDEPGWYVMFFSHHPIHNRKLSFPETGTSEACGVTPNHGGDSMLKIITAFSNCQAGTAICTTADFESEVNYDYTRNQSNTVIAMISGHTHLSSITQVNGITAITAKAVDGHATYRKSLGITSTGNYFVIDREANQLHWISCDICDQAGNAPSGTDYVLDFPVAEPGSSTVKCTGLYLKDSNLNVDIASEEKTQLEAIVLPIDCSQPVVWTSSDNSVVQVDSSGTVQVRAVGSSVITATCGGYEASMTINVVDFSNPVIDGWSIRSGYAINASADSYTVYSQGTRGYAQFGDSSNALIPIEGSTTYRVTVEPIASAFPEWKSIALNIMTFQGKQRIATEGWQYFDDSARTYEFTSPTNADGLTFNIAVCADTDTQAQILYYSYWIQNHIRIEKVG